MQILNGFPTSVVGKKLPKDSVLQSMKKAELIELLHIAQHNFSVLLTTYGNAIDENKCNRCPLNSEVEG